MDHQGLLDELLRVAMRLGVEVRIEPFEDPPTGAGGLCLVHGRELVLLDARAPLPDRVRALARALSRLDVDTVYMAPEARDVVEAASAEPGIPREHVPLAPHSTLGVGGPARFFLEARDEAAVLEAFRWATGRGVSLRVLGGGSNLVVADGGVDGLVLKIGLRGIATRAAADAVELTAAAGEPWDALVGETVARDWAGIECLSGIPGLVGATPIQNVGAYGQEVSQTLVAVRALDRSSGRVVTLSRQACGFAYRDSVFKSREPERYVVLAVTYRLIPGGAPTVRYAEVQQHLASRGITAASLRAVRESVLAIRRGKSMVLDDGDPNRRSCGSFFVNPVVTADEVARIEAVAEDAAMPRWPEPDGRVKLSGAWLIQRAGFQRGDADGPVGLSTRHTLALVAHEGARAADIVRFARRVRARVEARFGVRLVPEPVFWGFARFDGGLPAD
ncbi:MAG TPA: UDP-N-acetylmuramate dehydrogenase [Methylomirabilota bacterium]|nr:UDP-N-acetylmuramate dehydrogenase [Methylomirabilota bacterium]